MNKEISTYLDMFKPVVITEAENVEAKPKAEMKFSQDLAAEFSKTINEFTTICAKIVERKVVDKNASDRFYDLYAKIKNLADAASKSI